MRLGSARAQRPILKQSDTTISGDLVIRARAATGTFVSYLRTTTAPSRAKERHSRHNRT